MRTPAGVTGPFCRSAMTMSAQDADLLARLVEASRSFDGTASDPERNCWMAVHQHVHGVLPSEYDIRDVPEPLYLAVLELRRHKDGDCLAG